MIEITPVKTKGDWDRFIELPWSIYLNDANWVPPLRVAVKDILDLKKNPFWSHAKMHPCLALKNGKIVGRAIGVIDERHNDFHKEQTAFFGFFEAIDDQEVANALLKEIANWSARLGMKQLRGPVNPSTNHECGLLVEGFQDPSSVMMTYNPPYYGKLFETWGLAKVKDLFAYTISSSARFDEKLLAQGSKLKVAAEIKFREINMARFDDEIRMIMKIYNDAWEKNWGFVPMDPIEIAHMAKELKMVLDPSLVLIAEVKGQPAAFALTLPDVNQAIHGIRDGKLFPLGLLKLLWNFKGPGKKKTIKRCRILTLGIKKEFRDLGLGPLFYVEILERAQRKGYDSGEASWILEDNIPMNRALAFMAGQRSKVYRIYDKPLVLN